MLCFGGTDTDGRRVIGMLLSRENVDRLRGGEPVFFEGAKVGADNVIVLLHVTDSPTEDLRMIMQHTRDHGGMVRSIEEVLEERQAIRLVRGDPDAEPRN